MWLNGAQPSHGSQVSPQMPCGSPTSHLCKEFSQERRFIYLFKKVFYLLIFRLCWVFTAAWAFL